jgi:hypothetical protein
MEMALEPDRQRRANGLPGTMAALLVITALLFVAYWGVALLDSEYAKAACRSADKAIGRTAIKRLFACELPQPVSTLILWGIVAYGTWRSWREIACALLQKPKLRFDEHGIIALVGSANLKSGMNWMRFRWEHIDAVVAGVLIHRVKFIQLELNTHSKEDPARGHKFFLAYRDVRSDYYLTFFSVLSSNRPDLKEQVKNAVLKVTHGRILKERFGELLA